MAHPSLEVTFSHTDPSIFSIFLDACLSIFAHSEILSFFEKKLDSNPEMIAPSHSRL